MSDPPGCFMARQGNFITGFWPPEVQANLTDHVDTFLLLPHPGGFDGQAVLGAGGIFGTFRPDDPEVKAVFEAIYTSDFGWEWAKGGQYISPFPDFPADAYSDPLLAGIAEQVATADTFRFDGSDMMPGQVGSGSFWTQMTQWVTGQTDLDTALAAIEASWP